MVSARTVARVLLPASIGPLAVLAGWWAVSARQLLPPSLVPAPARVWHTFGTLLSDHVLLPSLLLSVALVGYGFLLGSVAGLLLGTLMGVSRAAERLLLPLFNGIRQVPLVAWVPMIVIWFGIGESSKVALIALGASYPVALNTFAGIRGVAREYIEVARVFEYSRWRTSLRVLLPAALPSILTGIRLSIGKSWTLVIGAEALMATVSSGVGNLMLEGGEQGRMDIVIVSIVVVGLVGFLMNQTVQLLELRLLRWHKGIT